MRELSFNETTAVGGGGFITGGFIIGGFIDGVVRGVVKGVTEQPGHTFKGDASNDLADTISNVTTGYSNFAHGVVDAVGSGIHAIFGGIFG